MRKLFHTLVLMVSLLLIWQVPANAADDRPVNWQTLPAPYATPSATNGPRVITQPGDAFLKVPEGFAVEEYLSGFDSPRYMILGPNLEILLSDTFVGKIYVIQNKEKKLLLKDLNNPYGLAFYQDWLYVAETTAVRRYQYDANTQTVTQEGELIVDLSEFPGGHITRTILFDAEGQKFYLSIGSRSNVDAGEAAMRAAISRFNPDGSGHEIFASGIRNGVGMRWYPASDKQQLWVSSHERDGLGDDLVPDYLSSVNQADFFGWPYAYIGPHEDPVHAGVAPDLVAKTRYPDVLLGSHVGAMDFIFYTGKQFPEHYRGGCFIALHGSWNRSQLAGYKIAFIPFESGKPVSGPTDFLTGWLLSPNSINVWGRPVGLLQMPDGSMLITDDAAGKIWRVTYTGQ